MLDERELWLDYREAMVAVREQRLQDLQQRALELEETERQHGQGNVENEPSRSVRRRGKKQKRRRWTLSEHWRVLKTLAAAKRWVRRAVFLGHPASKAQLVHTRLGQAWPKGMRRMDALQS